MSDFSTCKYTWPTSNKIIRSIVPTRIETKSMPKYLKLSLIKREKEYLLGFDYGQKQLNRDQIVSNGERFQGFRSPSPIQSNYLLSMSSIIDVQSHDI